MCRASLWSGEDLIFLLFGSLLVLGDRAYVLLGVGNARLVQFVKLILDLLKQLNEEMGMTIVMTSSELAELRSICDRIAIIKKGKRMYKT